MIGLDFCFLFVYCVSAVPVRVQLWPKSPVNLDHSLILAPVQWGSFDTLVRHAGCVSVGGRHGS